MGQGYLFGFYNIYLLIYPIPLPAVLTLNADRDDDADVDVNMCFREIIRNNRHFDSILITNLFKKPLMPI